MKIIVCSGDSHTCGQGADNIRTATKPKDPNRIYRSVEGKGLGAGACDPVDPSYVNLIRKYVTENFDSKATWISAQELAAGYGCTMQPNELNLEVAKVHGQLVLENSCELMVLCVCEQVEEAKLEVYLDGKLCKEETLVTPVPRYNEYSYRHIIIPCKDAKEVKLVAAQGDLLIRNIQLCSGKYAVINSGVGFCPSDRYRTECFPYCVADMKPDIVIAEGHTINDWIAMNSPEEHYESLKTLVEMIQGEGAKVIFTTVSPITGCQTRPTHNRLYQEFMDQSKKIAQLPGVTFVDSNAAFEKELEGMDNEQRFEVMYVDNWHVNARGHKLYADTINAKLAEIL